MIDIHPTHHGSFTLRDFFIHLFIIVLGILIAIGLEQCVEYLHHRHEIADLTGQMRVEAQNNIPLINDSIVRLKAQAGYIQALEDALRTGKVSGDAAEVHGVAPIGGSAFYVSPSRATWSSAQSAGLAALFPAGQAKLYARLDYNTALAIDADSNLHSMIGTLVSECVRAHYDHANPASQRITIAHRDDLLFQLEQVAGSIRSTVGSLSLVEGGDEAILAGAHSLNEMYPYQHAALKRAHIPGSAANFYNGTVMVQTQQNPFQPGGIE